MSAYIENNQQINYSQYLPTCDAPKGLSLNKTILKVKFWASRSKQRKQLARLDARMLADIGISPEQVKYEIAKPFWE